jgi:uncharacterized phage-associated protein
MAYSAKAVANAFLVAAKEQKVSISNMKLQKLLFFAHGIYLVTQKVPLIAEHPEAWQYGPVYVSVYHEFKNYGSEPIRSWATDVEFTDNGFVTTPTPYPNDAPIAQIINSVLSTYGNESAIALSAISHVPGGPWERTRRESAGGMHAEIPDQYIEEYFRKTLNEAERLQGAVA